MLASTRMMATRRMLGQPLAFRVVGASRGPCRQKATTSAKEKKSFGLEAFLQADTYALATKAWHYGNNALLVATPLAFFISPSPFVWPIDMFLGITFPLHSHVGMNGVITDYVPKAARPPARAVMAVVTVVTLLGLLKINIFGPGLTETFKSLWRPPKEEKK